MAGDRRAIHCDPAVVRQLGHAARRAGGRDKFPADLSTGCQLFRLPIGSGLLYTALTFACTLIGVFVVGLIINALAPSFSGRKDQRQAMKVSAYSLTPAMVSAVLSLSPLLPTLLQCLMGLFGIYVLYLGLPVVMQSPKEEAFGYTASVVICTVLFGIVLGVLNAMAHIGAGAHAALVGSSPAERVAEHDAARQQGAATVANAIGGLLGTDEKGKAGLNTALSNLAKAGDAQPQQPTTPAAAAGVLTALGGALGGDHPVQAVDFKSLTVSLPASLPGMTRTSAVGESQGALGVKASSAKADYRAGDGVRSVHVEIADVSGISGLMDLAGGLVQNTTSESDSGYEKDVALDDRSVHEKFDARSHAGELSTLIAKRYAVDVSGAGVDMEVLADVESDRRCAFGFHEGCGRSRNTIVTRGFGPRLGLDAARFCFKFLARCSTYSRCA